MNERKGQLVVTYYKNRLGKWSWNLRAGNRVHWSSPSKPKGFFNLPNAQRSFTDMVTALGGDLSGVQVKIKK